MNIEKRFCIPFIFILSGTLTFSETYDVSWSGILDRTVNQIKSGNEKIINPVLILSIKIVYGAFEGFIYSGSKLPLLQIEIPFKINIVAVFTYYGVLILVCLKLKKYLNNLKSNNLK